MRKNSKFHGYSGPGAEPLEGGVVDYYVADVLSQSDYYPFGMLLPNRNDPGDNDYRYSFQGQEKDNEIKGNDNSINYKYRMHDPRVGRFFAVDPRAPKYPHYTPYSFSGNKVIHKIELEGLEEEDFDYRKDPNTSKIFNRHDAKRVLNQYMGAYVKLHNSGQYEAAAELKSRIITALENSPYKPNKTFEITGANTAVGVTVAAASVGGLNLKTEPGSGNWENGALVEVKGLDAGLSLSGGYTGVSANVIIDGSITFEDNPTSVKKELEKAEITTNTSFGVGFIGGYQYDIYKGTSDLDGRDVIYTGSSHSYLAGVSIGLATTVTTLSQIQVGNIDSVKSALDNLI